MSPRKRKASAAGRRARAAARKENLHEHQGEFQKSRGETKVAVTAPQTVPSDHKKYASQQTSIKTLVPVQHVVHTSVRELPKKSNSLWPDLQKSEPAQTVANEENTRPTKRQRSDDETPASKPAQQNLAAAEDSAGETNVGKKRKVSSVAEGEAKKNGASTSTELISGVQPPSGNVTTRYNPVNGWLDTVAADVPEGVQSGILDDTQSGDSGQTLTQESTEPYDSADGAPVPRPTFISASLTPGVSHPTYRTDTLWTNGIQIRSARKRFPAEVRDHLFAIRTLQAGGPEASIEQMDAWLDEVDRLARGCEEDALKEFVRRVLLADISRPANKSSVQLGTGLGARVSQHLVINNTESPFSLGSPAADMLYGYSGHHEDGAFTGPQLMTQTVMQPGQGRFPQASTVGLRFPFLAIVVKPTWYPHGDHWAAANEFGGISAACVRAAETLNDLLEEHDSIHRVKNVIYCLAVDTNVAKLYVGWKDDEKEGMMYNVQLAASFLLSRIDDLQRLRNQMQNIMAWATGERLQQIQEALDFLADKLSLDEQTRNRQLRRGSNWTESTWE